jgi:hypothetical protein
MLPHVTRKATTRSTTASGSTVASALAWIAFLPENSNNESLKSTSDHKNITHMTAVNMSESATAAK